MRKFIEEHIRCEGVVDSDKWTDDYVRPIREFIDSYNEDPTTIINDVGFDDSDTLIVLAEFIGRTKKECEALSYLFRSRLHDLLKPYGLKKTTSILKAYGDKL